MEIKTFATLSYPYFASFIIFSLSVFNITFLIFSGCQSQGEQEGRGGGRGREADSPVSVEPLTLHDFMTPVI